MKTLEAVANISNLLAIGLAIGAAIFFYQSDHFGESLVMFNIGVVNIVIRGLTR